MALPNLLRRVRKPHVLFPLAICLAAAPAFSQASSEAPAPKAAGETLSVWLESWVRNQLLDSKNAGTDGKLKFCPSGREKGIPCLEIAPEALERGGKQFAQSCGSCHGPTGTGGFGPNLLLSTLVRHDEEGEKIAPVIREGRMAQGMPSIPLNEAQIKDIVDFLHARIVGSARTSMGPPSHEIPLEQLLTGNAQAGEAFFNGTDGCSGCHSGTGDLEGIAGKYSPVELQARMLYPGRSPVEATVTLSDGTKVAGELLTQDFYDVSIRDSKGWYRSWPIDSVKVETRDPMARHLELLSVFTTEAMHDVFAYLETFK